MRRLDLSRRAFRTHHSTVPRLLRCNPCAGTHASLFLAIYGLGEDAKNLEHHGGANEGGVAAGIEGRRHLYDVAPDQIEALQTADHALRLGGRKAADLRCAGARGIGGVQSIYVEADINGAISNDAARFCNDPFDTEGDKFLDVDDAYADVARKFLVVEIIERAANPNLDRSLRVEQILLDGTSERRSMGIFLATEIAVAGVRVSVKMYHAHRSIAGNSA